MGNYQSEPEFERQRLEETVALAKCQLSQARLENEDSLSEIISEKQEMREEAAQSISNLCNSQEF